MFSADRGLTHAIHRASDKDRAAARPLALPALAAAVHVVSNAAQAARAKRAARTIRPFVHEDQPTD